MAMLKVSLFPAKQKPRTITAMFPGNTLDIDGGLIVLSGINTDHVSLSRYRF